MDDRHSAFLVFNQFPRPVDAGAIPPMKIMVYDIWGRHSQTNHRGYRILSSAKSYEKGNKNGGRTDGETAGDHRELDRR